SPKYAVDMHAHGKLLAFGHHELHGRTHPASIAVAGRAGGVKGTTLQREGGAMQQEGRWRGEQSDGQ
ncbi:TPA: hypothetical protein ACU9T0_006167, partial [Burkholderia cenocepacia]